MSVATKNPFALLDDDEAPSAPVTTEEPAPAPPPAARGDAAQKSRGGPASRGGKYYSRGGKPQSRDTPPVAEEANKPANDARGERRGRGRGRGGRGGRGGDPNYRGRPFDRHSQTGHTDSDKKINQSWGGADGNTEFETETAAKVDAVAEVSNEWGAEPAAAGDWGGAAETSADAWATPAADAPAPAAEPDAKPEGRPRREREPEEDDNTLTLDQYLAQQKEKDTVIPKLENTRKANEGADDNWKDVVPLAKNEEEDSYFVGKSKTYKARPKKEEKVYLEIDARFERPDRGGGRGRGRGDRGGDYRGGDRSRGHRGGRGGPRTGGRQNGGNAPAVNVDDQTDFPSLS